MKIFKKFLNIKIWLFKNFLSERKLESYPKMVQPCLFLGKGEFSIDKKVQFGYFPSPLFYSTYSHIEARNEKSQIIIQENTYINNNACIISNGAKIEIGKNCRIGTNFQCFDSDFHGTNVEGRDNADDIANREVVIGDNVFIGNNVIILKGVNIGEGSIIGAGSVVTKSFPINSFIAGCPAKEKKL